LKHILRQGHKVGNHKVQDDLPPPGTSGVTSSQTTPEGADDMYFGLLVVRPFCRKDGNNSLFLRFRARVTDAVIAGGPAVQAEYDRRRERIRSILFASGTRVGNSEWAEMSINFTPSTCKIEEEDDPPQSGPSNYKSDSLTGI